MAPTGSAVKRRNTAQKQVIRDTLAALGSHVSAGEIYQKLGETHPTIGRATVFRVLSDMADDGTLLRIRIPGTDDRFDTTAYPHHHILCRCCGAVNDVWYSEEPDLTAHIRDTSGFVIENAAILFTGVCESCRRAEHPSDSQ